MEVSEFKYLGTILCKDGNIKGEVRERAVKGTDSRCGWREYEREKCEHGEKERHKEQYYPANFVICIRDVDMGCSIRGGN